MAIDAPQLEMSTEGRGSIMIVCAVTGACTAAAMYLLAKGVALKTVENANKALEQHIMDKTINFLEDAFTSE